MVLTKYLYSHKNQTGVVLVVSLVFLVALTAVAGALMQHSSVDMKMAGASQNKLIATQEAISTVDEIIQAQVTGASGANDFAMPIVQYTNKGRNVILDLDAHTRKGLKSARVFIANNQYGRQPHCPHMREASSVGKMTCNILRISVNKNYGRTNNNRININTGIAQMLLGQN